MKPSWATSTSAFKPRLRLATTLNINKTMSTSFAHKSIASSNPADTAQSPDRPTIRAVHRTSEDDGSAAPVHSVTAEGHHYREVSKPSIRDDHGSTADNERVSALSPSSASSRISLHNAYGKEPREKAWRKALQKMKDAWKAAKRAALMQREKSKKYEALEG